MKLSNDSFKSLIRSILTVVGTYVAGRNFFGHIIDPQLWQGIAGTGLALGMAIWGYMDKATNLEGFESLLRTAGVAAGGVAVALGWLKNETMLELLGIGSILGPVLLSKLARFKNKQVDEGKLVTDGSKLVKAGPKVSIMLLILVGASLAGNAQSLFKPLPKPDTNMVLLKGKFRNNPQALFSRAVPATSFQVTDTLPIGQDFTGLRIDGPAIMYLFPNNTVISTIGLSYEHDTYIKTTGKFYTDWSIAAVVGAGGYFAPKDPTAVALVGLKVSVFNHLLAIGVFYNLTTRQAQAGVGGGTALNN